jgi:hypothetical protein
MAKKLRVQVVERNQLIQNFFEITVDVETFWDKSQ